MNKKFVFFLSFVLIYGFNLISAPDKYICAREVMEDDIFTDVYATREECNKYCTGIGTVCQRTESQTKVDTADVDF